MFTFAQNLIIYPLIGALAHLARALDWQSKGDRFESDMLHKPHFKSGILSFYSHYIQSLSVSVKTDFSTTNYYNSGHRLSLQPPTTLAYQKKSLRQVILSLTKTTLYLYP